MMNLQIEMSRAPMNRCRNEFVNPWLHREHLADRVQEAVETADWSQTGPLGMPFPKNERNATFLAILTYCYALGIYPTREIMEDLAREKGGAALVQAGINGSCLRRFRRGFKPLLAQCLAVALQAAAQLAEEHSQEGWMEPAPTMSPETCAAEAERRIGLAVEWDSADLDE